MNIPELILATTTTSSREEADRIARDLLDRRLAACVQIIENIKSVYRWQGDVHEENEFLLLIKSDRSLLMTIEERLAQIHSYDVPELVAVPLAEASEAYGDWLRENLTLPRM